MKKILKKFGRNIISYLLYLVTIVATSFAILPQAASATTYPTMDDMITAINNGTAVKYTDVVNFGTYGGNTLQWIYMGPNQDTSDTSAKSEPYFIMTKGSYQTMNYFDYHPIWWLSTFKTNNLNDDQRIFEITLPSKYDYDYLIHTIMNEGNYRFFQNTSITALRTPYPNQNNFMWFVDNYSGTTKYQYNGYQVAAARPAFYLKSEYLGNDVITFNGRRYK